MTQPVSRSGSACNPSNWKEDHLNGSMDYVPARANNKMNASRQMSLISAEGGRYRETQNS